MSSTCQIRTGRPRSSSRFGFIESLPHEAQSTIEAVLGMFGASVVDD